MSVRGVIKKPEDDKPWGDLMSFWKSSEPPMTEEAAASAAKMKRSISDRQTKGKVDSDKLTRDEDDDYAPPPMPAGANRASMHGLADEDREKIQQAFQEAEENFKEDFSDGASDEDDDDAGMSLTKGKDKKKRGIFARKNKTTELDPNAPSTVKVTQDNDDGHLTLAAKDKVAKRRSKARAKNVASGEFAYDSDHSSDSGSADNDDASNGLSFVSASKSKPTKDLPSTPPTPSSPAPSTPTSVKPLPQPNKRPPSNRNLNAGLRPKPAASPSPNPNPNPSPNPSPNPNLAPLRGNSRVSPLLSSALAGRECCDCGAADPQWAVTKYGIFVCAACVMVHRQMLPMAEQKCIKAIDDPSWESSPTEVSKMKGVQHAAFNREWEANVLPEFAAGKPKPGSMDQAGRDRWIRAKYGGRFRRAGSRPPPPQQQAPAVPGDKPAVDREDLKAAMLELLREDREFRTEVRKALNLRKVQRKKK